MNDESPLPVILAFPGRDCEPTTEVEQDPVDTAGLEQPPHYATLAARRLAEIEARVEARYAPLLSGAGSVRRWWLTWRKERDLNRELERWGLYLSWLVRAGIADIPRDPS